MTNYKLKEIGKIVTGKTPSSKEAGVISDEESEYLFVTPRDMNQQEKVISRTERYITNKVSSSFDKIILRGKSICVSCIGTVGKVFMVNKPSITNQQINSITSIDDRKCNADYLYYLLSTMSEEIQNLAGGTTMPIVNKSAFENLEIALPDTTTQNKVANILSGLDERIASNNRTNDNLEKQGSLLVDDYFSKCLDEVSLSTILSFANGFAFSSKDYLESGKYKIVTIKNVQDGKIDPAGASCLNEIPERMNKDCELKVGDILLSLTGNVGRVGAVCDGNLLLNQRVAKIIPNNSTILPLLYFIFRQDSMKNTLESISKGTAQQNLSPVETLKLKIKFDAEKADNYSAILEPILNKIIGNNIENRRLIKLRDTLLPELLNGKIDVSNIDI